MSDSGPDERPIGRSPAAITCDDAFAVFEAFAAHVLAGRDAGAHMPKVRAHLEHCRDCANDFGALIGRLEALSNHACWAPAPRHHERH